MKILDYKKLGLNGVMCLIGGARSQPMDVADRVRWIIQRVKKDGDKALFEFARQFDKVELNTFAVDKSEMSEAKKKVSGADIAAIKLALGNIEKFHRACLVKKQPVTETVAGVRVWREFRPVQKVGLYIPGGLAAYPSTVLMLAGPARLAGCEEIVMCTPCDSFGVCNPYVLVAADLCGVKKIFKVGGAQAIAAMAFGTESIPQVYKIFGPGNQYVSTAKALLQSEVAIDMPAGPSELLIVVDENADVSWIAADMLSQLEHGADSQSVLVTFSNEFAQKVKDAMLKQSSKLSRKELINKSFEKSFIVVVENIAQVVALVDAYAPEHLEIVTRDPAKILAQVSNFGSAFLGRYSCESLGDYATGSNHTLPTSGFAKMFPPLAIESFGKMVQIQSVSKKGFDRLADTVERLAAMEGLDAHKNSVTIRK